MRFRPSKSPFWSKCAAYVSFTKDVPKKPNDAAREGTATMSVIEGVLKGDSSTAIDYEGETHRNGWLITKDMCDDAQDFIDWVRAFGGQIECEQFVVADTSPDIAGTLDTRTLINATTPGISGILHVIDFKYGHRPVEVKHNPQLVIYGYGEAKRIGWTGDIKTWIYQPRCVHRHGVARSHLYTGEQIAYEFEKLRNMAIEGAKPNPTATPGKHCRDCEVASKCVALTETTYDFIDVVQSRDLHDMTPQQLSQELKLIDTVEATIKARFDAVKTEAQERIKNENIPGWGMSQKYGHCKFSADPITILMKTGVDPWDKKLASPAEVERRGANKEIMKTLTTQPKTGMKLHRIDGDDIAAMFKG